MPEAKKEWLNKADSNELYKLESNSILSDEEYSRLKELRIKANELERKSFKDNFYSSHFEEPNILAHVRFNERTDKDGSRVLFIEEWQADKGQEWQKLKKLIDSGKATKADIDRFNFLDKNFTFNKTSEWLSLAMRRMMRYAAENGFDRIAWTPGEVQADRYKEALAKEIDSIEPTDKNLQNEKLKQGCGAYC